ncbi:MAG: hypothetical protein AABZ74_04880 [Cyanobacteriota bacterium]
MPPFTLKGNAPTGEANSGIAFLVNYIARLFSVDATSTTAHNAKLDHPHTYQKN